MQKITKQEFESIAKQANPNWYCPPMWETAGRGWYQHGELLGIVLHTETGKWCFDALRKDWSGNYDGFTFQMVSDDEPPPTFEAAEAELEAAIVKGPHPIEAELRALIAKYAPYATEDELIFWGTVFADAADEVNAISEKRFPHDDEEE